MRFVLELIITVGSLAVVILALTLAYWEIRTEVEQLPSLLAAVAVASMAASARMIARRRD